MSLVVSLQCKKVLSLLFKRHTWVKAFVVIGGLLCSLAAWGQNLPASGPYRVLTVERLVLHDAARNKDLPLKIYYPDAPGPFPVIIFSHGALASKDCYSELGQYWASFGYVSIHPSHGDSIADSGFRGTLREAISDPAAGGIVLRTSPSSSIRFPRSRSLRRS